MANFSYSELPLDDDGPEIRLLQILPNPAPDVIECNLFFAHTREHLSYRALSYAWGDIADEKHTITINGKPFQVRENLWHALIELKASLQEPVLWIDAICIDQGNIAERNHQVGLMRKIYQEASEVIVWLGVQQDESHVAFQVIERICQLRDFQQELERYMSLLDSPKLKYLENLFRRPFWTRIWVVQEVSLAKRITVYCGQDRMNWSDITDIQRLLFQEGGYGYRPIDFAPACQNWLQVRSEIRFGGPCNLHATREAFITNGLSIYEALQHNIRGESTDPRDMVYGLLGVGRTESAIVPNYLNTVDDLYTEFARLEITQSQSLSIITKCYHKKPSQFELPSWVQDWSMRPERHIYLQGVQQPQYAWSAAHTTKADVAFPSGKILVAAGLKLGSINSAGACYCVGFHDNDGLTASFVEWMSLLGNDIDNEEAQEKLCRCTLAGLYTSQELPIRISSGVRGDEFTESEFLRGFLGQRARDWLELHPGRSNEVLERAMEYQRKTFPESEGMKEVWPNWTQSAQQISWNRNLFVGDSGMMGLGPDSLKTGDIVCVLLGCSVPVLLRPIGDGYTLQGEAYVDGFMRGKAIDLWEKGELELQRFTIH